MNWTVRQYVHRRSLRLGIASVVLAAISMTGAAWAQPINDNCSGATPISSVPFADAPVIGNTATTGLNPTSSCSSFLMSREIWYSYTAPTTPGGFGYATLSFELSVTAPDVFGSNFGRTIWVYEGSCNSLTRVGRANSPALNCVSSTSNSGPLTYEFIAQDGHTYYILVGTSSSAGTLPPSTAYHVGFNVQQVPAAPANDQCSAAVNIASLPFSDAVQVAGATNDFPPNACQGNGAGGNGSNAVHGIWYAYTPASNQLITFDRLASTATTPVLGIFTGSCGSLTHVGCFLSPTDVFALRAGTPYHFLVSNQGDSVMNPAEKDGFTISSIGAPPAAPGNDSCSSPTVISSLPFSASVPITNTYDDLDAACEAAPESLSSIRTRGIWYSYTPANGTFLKFGVTFGNPNAIPGVFMAVFTGNCGGLMPIACLKTNEGIAITGGVTYSLLIAGRPPTDGFGRANNATYDFSITGIGTSPSNDACAGATSISSIPYSNTVSILAAGGDMDTDCNASTEFSTARGVWYTYTNTTGAPRSLALLADGPPTDYYGTTAVTVFQGGCGSLSPIACGDWAGELVFTALPGTTYSILAGDYLSGYASNDPMLIMKAISAIPTTNDVCANAVNIPSFPYFTAIDNSSAVAGYESGAPLCEGGELHRSVFFQFTPARSGTLTVTDNCVGNFYGYDTQVVLYTGNCGSLTPAACSSIEMAFDDPEYGSVATLTASVSAGTHYTLGIGRNDEDPEWAFDAPEILAGVNVLHVTMPCSADFNGDNIRDVADLFGYINAWLAKASNADFNHDSVVDVADLFGYINAWLAGC